MLFLHIVLNIILFVFLAIFWLLFTFNAFIASLILGVRFIAKMKERKLDKLPKFQWFTYQEIIAATGRSVTVAALLAIYVKYDKAETRVRANLTEDEQLRFAACEANATSNDVVSNIFSTREFREFRFVHANGKKRKRKFSFELPKLLSQPGFKPAFQFA